MGEECQEMLMYETKLGRKLLGGQGSPLTSLFLSEKSEISRCSF